MAKLFLRSGSLDDLLALGENGQAVYASALQLRETLRLRKKQHIADCLAIPQPNEQGDRLDWYAPVEGKVTSWATSSHSERQQALRQLEACQAEISQIVTRAQASEKSSQKLFGALLSKAIQFPDQNYVYLVGGQPVITFWGFVKLDKKSRDNALEALRPMQEEMEPIRPRSKIELSAPLISRPVVAEKPAKKAMEPETANSEAGPVTPTTQPSRRGRALWLLPAAALVIALVSVVALHSYTSEPKLAEAKQAPQAILENSDKVKTPAPLAVLPSPPVAPSPALPVAQAAVIATEEKPVVLAPAPAPVTIAKNALVLPADEVKIGSIKFLDGNWRVTVDSKDPLFGKPPMFKYQIKDGVGFAKITYSSGVNCRVPVTAGLMKSGNLVINTKSKARCSDDSRYQMPQIICSQDATGAAVCNGRFNNDSVYPMTIKRESK
ncbi:MAG: SrfA family protein [Rouxiella aceris]|uniref:SrfA family protein n=1 Tax=Rouxiella aceris TaxID=2703884 RepID=UPI00283FCE7E|nr:SrfA family protein [Rouxiella aceris]MDR3434944.1 SrfA family protein [Rouxiella aceris]